MMFFRILQEFSWYLVLWQNSDRSWWILKKLYPRLYFLLNFSLEFFRWSRWHQNYSRIPVRIPIGNFLLTLNFSLVEFTIKICTEILTSTWGALIGKNLTRETRWLWNCFRIGSEFLKNHTAVCFSDETLSELRNSKELWSYSVGILSVDQMESEFFKKIPVRIPIGNFLLTLNFSPVEFTINISTELDINKLEESYQRN